MADERPSDAEKVVMALTDTDYGYLVHTWRPSEDKIIRVPQGTIQNEAEARAMHRAIRLAAGKTTPGDFGEWLRRHAEQNGWTWALSDAATAASKGDG